MNYKRRERIRNGFDFGLKSRCFGSKGSAPAAPDYVGAAGAQGEAGKDIATQQTWANRPNQFSPFGSSTWGAQAQIDPATGKPVTSWTQEQQLNPLLQGTLDSQFGMQKGRSDLAAGQMGRVQQDLGQPFDWTNLPGMQGLSPTTKTSDEAGFSADRERYTNAAFDSMRPEHQRQEESARTRLANQGLTPGSDAYNTELERLAGTQANERWNAVNQGGVEQQRMQQMLMQQQGQAFGQESQQADVQNRQRQQAIAEQAQQRGMSLNEMNALITGQQVAPPQMPGFTSAQGSQAPNLLGAAQSQGQFGQQQYATDMQNQQNTTMGLGSLAAMAAMYFSDLRLKTNLRKIGAHRLGIGIYEFVMFGRRQTGVVAQELMQVRPDLVVRAPSGYLMVNYGEL